MQRIDASATGALHPDQIRRALSGASPEKVALALWLGQYASKMRPRQIAPPGGWTHWIITAGRGFGKTHAGAGDAIRYCALNPGARYAVVAPTHSDVRKTCFEGVSGIVAQCPLPLLRGGTLETAYNQSLLQIRFANGSLIEGHSAETPNRLRGPQYHRAWCDELAVWQRMQDTWDMLMFGLRLGDHPQTIITTTPRPVALLRELLKREGRDVVVTRGSTFDNAANLAASALEQLRLRYEGSRLGRQELYGELIDEIVGALFQLEWISSNRLGPNDVTPDLQRVVVSVDPSGSAAGDDAGIVAIGRHGSEYYPLEDRSRACDPHEWAREAVKLYDDVQADSLLFESNYGKLLTDVAIRAAAREMYQRGERSNDHVNISSVAVFRGKVLRAEPVASLYAQGKVHHVGVLRDLEDEMTAFTSNWDRAKDGSPGRLDALVMGITDLQASAPSTRSMVFGSMRIGG